MFRKARKRLTILFTLVSGIILIVMTLLYLYLSTMNLLDNEYTSFESNVSTYVANCENRLVISYDWLSKLEQSQHYQLFLYDNEVSFLFNQTTQNPKDIELAEDIRKQNQTLIDEYITENPIASFHIVFPYHPGGGKHYYAGIGCIPRGNGYLTLIVIYPLDNLYHQLNKLYIQAGIIVLVTCTLLFFFSYSYTGHLLRPIEENQKRQVDFISAASHELRTPVAAIRSSISAAKIASNTERDNFLDASLIETDRLTTLVNEMLTLARNDSQRMSLHIEDREPDTLLLEVYEAYLAMAREHQLTLQIQLPKDAVPMYSFDYDKIFQVLAILIHNAISYTPSGGTIILSLNSDNKRCTFSVQDNGCGIPESDRGHLYERFYRGDKSRTTTGKEKTKHFGLGLSIAKEIMDAHKGTISFKETPGGGSTFCIIL